jgi:hypothetical protein
VAGAPLYVKPPLFTPSPYGLITAVDTPPAGDLHWTQGVIYQPMCADPSSWYDECIAITGVGGAPPPPPQLANTVDASTRMATSFTVALEFDCTRVGNEDSRAESEAAFASAETWQMERTFWTGIAAGQMVAFPHLAANAAITYPSGSTAGGLLLQSAAVIVSGVGGGVNPATGLGALEGALADCYNGVGVIHVPEVAAPTLDSWGLLKKGNGTSYMTANGNKVAIGAGYPGTSPAGAARVGTECWLYATGNIFCYRTMPKTRASDDESFDRVKNTQKMITERTYLFGWDCCHLAVNIALGTPKGT